MNSYSHREIMGGAYRALPEEYRRCGSLTQEQVVDSGNYPDYFDDGTCPAAKKAEIDPNWETFAIYPPETGTTRLHAFPQGKSHFEKQKLYAYLLGRIHDSFRAGHYEDYVKFMGCFSHAMGDSTQPAHIGPDFSNKWLSQMLPVPDKPELKTFHYHTTVEAVNGRCATLGKPRLLGLTPGEIAWAVSAETEKATIYCRRFIIPTVQAIFAGNMKEAERLADEPVTIAARLTLDAVYSILEADKKDLHLPDLDLRTLPTIDSTHNLVYNGNFILDHNRQVPPNNGPLVPGALLLNGARTELPGLGMLPQGGKGVHSTWKLPVGTFREFHAWAGMNADIGQGAVAFNVELDGKLAWDSQRMTERDHAKEISLKLGNAETITLRVLDANDGQTFWTNHAYWGKPTLLR